MRDHTPHAEPAPPDDPALRQIRDRALAGERLTLDEGAACYATDDLWGLCRVADELSKRLHGDRAYYNVNRHLNYSNICALSCKFCEFYRKAGDDGAYEMSIERIRREAADAQAAGATEIHIVGGLHPTLPFSYYTDLCSAIRDAAPGLHIKAFTAVEIVHFARIARRHRREDPAEGIRWVLERLIEAGLGSLPGGGAEVFDDRVHDDAYKGKIRSDVWLTVHRVAHELGLNTNATILYGHIEQRGDRLVHMDMLRTAQDEALRRMGYAAAEDGAITLTKPGAAMPTPNDEHGYFQTIIPLPFIPDGSELERLPGPSGLENLRTIAVSRLMLDNFPHVKAFWIMQTLPMAELMLQAGADDIDGTVVWYDITKVGASSTHQETTTRDLQRSIRNAALTPVERDTRYRPVVRDGSSWRLAEAAGL
ncbi:MAG: CofH family radical SAM protein [Phycisphaeraceae bacterium]|nr:CofH family radical SAM protein [Phycisphaeraceae bacterium]